MSLQDSALVVNVCQSIPLPYKTGVECRIRIYTNSHKMIKLTQRTRVNLKRH